ncbi:RHS repeat-associated core domain-containing protein [Methylomonas methanica]|uniref:RHS repeat-associated core domain protein n=1 Tax=Methylomonas methanica (strain DSM 25384 / MC09) TaxID=857087 RepID=F9ZVR3_METMM|nr:RHS repeat-associated core domain-containing protein [Methylomonas methanica]AEF99541.1 RHS repeat-associated core domain protein [Methylomonas methanica MC09]
MSRVSHLRFVLALAFLCQSLFATSSLYAAPQEAAVLPDAVVQTLLKVHQQPGNPLVRQLSEHLDEAADLLDEADAEDRLQQGGQANLLSSKRELLEAKRSEIADLRQDVEAELQSMRSKLEGLKHPGKLADFEHYAKQVAQRFERIDHALSGFSLARKAGDRRRALGNAKAELRSLHRHRPSADFAPEAISSPTNRLGVEAIPTPLEPSKKLPRYLSAGPYKPDVPGYAFLLDVLDLLAKPAEAAAPSTPYEALACGYVPADLNATEDVVISQEIQDLAAKLGYSPVKIYQYVYNNIRFEPYFGSMKGSVGTLYSGAGGATDQASLLIALFRASNIPARYILGDIQVNDASNLEANGRGPRWIGAKTYQAAASILATNQNPNAGSYANGIQLRHVWVEACLPYGNYRGASSDNTGYRWIPLDPSFKDKTYQAGIAGIQSSVVFDYSTTGYLSSRTNALPHERYASQVETYIKGLNADNTLLDVPYLGEQIARSYDILPITLPYKVVQYGSWAGTSSSEIASLPNSHRYHLSIKVKNSSNADLVAEQILSLPSIVHQRVTLSYTPDAGSQAIWDSWNGDLSSLPASLVNLHPVIKVDGVTQVTGTGSLTLGTQHRLIMKVTLDDTTRTPSCPNDDPNNATPDTDQHCFNKTVYTNLTAGAHHALMAYARQGSDRFIAERTDRLIQTVQAAPTAPTPANANNYDDTEGEFLHIALMKYLSYVTEANRQLGELHGVSGESGNHLGLTAAGLKVDYLFDLPFAVHPSGPYIDVKGNLAHFVKQDSTIVLLDTDSAATKQAKSAAKRAEIWPTFKLSSYSASAYEHFIWQELIRTDAVSTVRGIQFANENAITLRTFTPMSDASFESNWTAWMDTASMAGVKSAIKTEVVSRQSTVTVPRSTIAYTDGGAQPKTWNGAVYMVENQTLGYFSAIIGGSLGGGYPLVNPSPVTLSYPRDSFLPASFYASALINSTTLSNGWNALQSWGGDPVNLATGNLYHSERDISVPGRGLPLVFERNYNSRTPKDGPLGFGWTHSFNHKLNFYGSESGYVKVGWLDGSGAERFFRLAGTTVPVGSSFEAAPGVYSILKREADGSWSVTEKNGLRYDFESNAGTTAGQSARLLTIKDRNLNTLTLAYNSGCGNVLCTVTDGPGRQLAFSYTAGRISQLQVKAIGGSVLATHQYGYDADGNLASYKSPLAVANQHAPLSYTYYTAADGHNLAHALKTTSAPQGEGMQFSYYVDGRVFRHQRHNNGTLLPETTTFRYQDFRRETVTVNERGYERRHTFDENGNPLRIVDETGMAHTYSYDPANPFNRLSETDPAGLATQYQYDAAGNVTQITQPSGATTEYHDFTAFNAPQRIKDALGNWTLLKYDAKGNLTDTVKLKTGKVPTAGATPALADIAAWSKRNYDAATGQPTQSKTLRDFSGATLGNFTSGAGPTVTTTYDANTLYPTQIARLGDKTGDGVINAADPADTATLHFDSLGRQTQGIEADWHTQQTVYDADGLPISTTDATGRPRDVFYDGDGRPTGQELVVSQSGQTILVDSDYRHYDAAGRLQHTLDAGGHIAQYQYDAAGNLTQITDPDNYTLGFDYDPVNRWTKAYDKAGHAVSRKLDAAGRIKSVTDPNGNSTLYSYWNAAQDGRLKSVTQPKIAGYSLGQSRQFDYDALGQIVKVTDTPAAGSTDAARDTLNTYDALSRLIRVAGPQVVDSNPSSATFGQPIRPLTRYVYDHLGHLLEIQAGQTTADGGAAIDPDTGVSPNDSVATQASTVYDDFGRKLSETDANNQTTIYSYDLHNNVVSQQTPGANGHTLTYLWDYGHQLLSVTAEDGRKIDYSRNPLGQTTRAEAWSANPGSQIDVAYDYVYDAAHRLKTASDSRGQKNLIYSWSPGGLLDYTADSDGARSDYLYDETGRLIGLWAPNYDHYTFDYDNGGRLIAARYPNGIDQTLVWNADNSLNKIAHKNAATVIAQASYGYDGLGRRKTNQETLSGQATLNYSYQYDALDRLTQVNNGAQAQAQAFGYDVLGNRVQKQIGNPVTATTAYAYDAANQLTEVRQTNLGGTLLEAYLYEEAGNQSQKCGGTNVTRPNDQSCSGSSQSQYHYDSFQRLDQVVANGTTTSQYAYDHQGRRIQKTEGSTTTNYLYDGQNIYAEYPGTSWTTPAAQYVQAGLDHPLARLTGQVNLPTATAAYYHQDGLGSVLAMTNATKAVTATQRFDAFGSKIGGANTVPQYGYTGREPDASGLIYYRARYYDPNQTRFTQRDPLGYTDGVNPYLYVHNNPINFNDPNGLLMAKVSNAVTPSISYFTSGQFSQTLGDTTLAFGGAVQNNPTIGLTGTVPILAVPAAPQMLALGSVASGETPLGLGGLSSPMRSGQIAEAEQLAALNSSGKVSFTPTATQIDSAAFKIIVGEAKYTAAGTPVGTIYDGSIASGLAEIKNGASTLNSSYQLRLQTYGSLVNNTPYSIYTSRPVNQTFQEWLTNWGVSVKPLPK